MDLATPASVDAHDRPQRDDRAHAEVATSQAARARAWQLGLPFDDGAIEAMPPLPGEVAFASPETQLQRRAELLGAGALVVALPSDAQTGTSTLAERIDERIERELAARGAPSPYLASWSSMPDDVEARLADQLFRARSVGACGIALLFGGLQRGDGPLGAEDSATLRFLLRSTKDRPLVVLLDDADRQLRAYDAPVRVTTWMGEPERPEPFAARAAEPAPSSSRELDLEEEARPSTLPPGVASVLLREDAGDLLAAYADAAPHTDVDADANASADASANANAYEEVLGEVIEDDEELLLEDDLEGDDDLPEAELTERAPPVAPLEAIADGARVAVAFEEPAARVAETAHARATVGIPVARSVPDAWRAWALALSATRGPQPLHAFEKLFADSYMPLANAIAEGLDDPRALRAHDDFRAAFERAYLDASATFGVTTRRPRMVMDAFDLALKHSRAHNARTTQVLLVDSLRADVAVHARATVERLAAGRVSLASESLVWSAMPTTTVRQLETLARGVDALRAPAQGDPPPESLRGRTAEHARRLRIGSRELFKLDVVPSLLAQTTTSRMSVSEALPRIGEAVGEAIVRHVASLPARTLLFVVGDHGFTVDRRGRLDHGGATPEEVLVPAQAWLVGDLH